MCSIGVNKKTKQNSKYLIKRKKNWKKFYLCLWVVSQWICFLSQIVIFLFFQTLLVFFFISFEILVPLFISRMFSSHLISSSICHFNFSFFPYRHGFIQFIPFYVWFSLLRWSLRNYWLRIRLINQKKLSVCGKKMKKNPQKLVSYSWVAHISFPFISIYIHIVSYIFFFILFKHFNSLVVFVLKITKRFLLLTSHF